MRNAISNARELIVSYLNDDDYVKSISSITQDELDFDKDGLFPLVNVLFSNIDFQTNEATFEITVLNLHHENKDAPIEKFNTNNNLIDNLNLAYSILQTLKLKLKQRNDFDFEFVSMSNPQIVSKAFNNKLDGMIVDVTLMLPNKVNICC